MISGLEGAEPDWGCCAQLGSDPKPHSGHFPQPILSKILLFQLQW
jgi:hypothetical protein